MAAVSSRGRSAALLLLPPDAVSCGDASAETGIAVWGGAGEETGNGARGGAEAETGTGVWGGAEAETGTGVWGGAEAAPGEKEEEDEKREVGEKKKGRAEGAGLRRRKREERRMKRATEITMGRLRSERKERAEEMAIFSASRAGTGSRSCGK